MTSDQLKALLAQEVKSLSSVLVTADYTNAVAAAQRETWDCPVTSDYKIEWLKRRSHRHLMFYLMMNYSKDFHAKNYHLQQRFDHFFKMIEFEDKEFAKEKEANPDMFPALIPDDVDSYKLFGTVIDAGFAYNGVGKDTTYLDDNEVDFSPSDES